MGGLSGEREISILTGKACMKDLRENGYITFPDFGEFRIVTRSPRKIFIELYFLLLSIQIIINIIF